MESEEQWGEGEGGGEREYITSGESLNPVFP